MKVVLIISHTAQGPSARYIQPGQPEEEYITAVLYCKVSGNFMGSSNIFLWKKNYSQITGQILSVKKGSSLQRAVIILLLYLVCIHLTDWFLLQKLSSVCHCLLVVHNRKNL